MTMPQVKVRTVTARQTFEQGRTRLFGPDGSQVYSDAEHALRLGCLRSERNSAPQQIERQATEEIFTARNGPTTFSEGDPTILLTTEKFERANLRAAVILDNVASLTREELISRLEAVLHVSIGIIASNTVCDGQRSARQHPEERALDTFAGHRLCHVLNREGGGR